MIRKSTAKSSPPSLPEIFYYSFNLSRYALAASTASSTLSTFVPFPILVGAFPPAFPPTTAETTFAHSDADAPDLDAVCSKTRG